MNIRSVLVTRLARGLTSAHWVLLAGLLCVASCQGSPNYPVLTEPEALQLAVDLANNKAEEQSKTRPFTLESYPILQDGERWHWGQLDVGAPTGLSAEVSFDMDGDNPEVEVFLSSDEI